MNRHLKRLSLSLAILVLAAGIWGTAPRAAASDVSGTVTQSYNADPSVLPGMVVGTKTKDASTVIPLTAKDIRNMAGVVVPDSDAAVVLTPQSSSVRQVLVAAAGRHGVLVSNQGGAIKAGDYLTMSSLDGIGMKADNKVEELIGRAAGGFSGKGNVLGTVSIKDGSGHTTAVSVGYIPADIRLAANPQFRNLADIPAFLTSTASNVANKPVTPTRAYLSTAILLSVLFISGSMFYGTVRSSIVATGRNPFAKKAIGRNMIQAIAAALVVFAAGLFAVYLILNL